MRSNRHRLRHALRLGPPLVALLLLGACGGGDRPADVVPSSAIPAPAPVAGPDSFLLWPNALRTPDGAPPPIDSMAYAQAYYAAIDPTGAKDTLAKWKDANGFDQPGGQQVSAVFGDFRDLGYGRRMTARRNTADNTVAFFVENYLVNPGAEGYGRDINLDAAVALDRQWRVSINAIEFSPGPNGGTFKYAKFYSFDPASGERRLMQDLDGRGPKALPGVCIACHGGRADALTSGGAFPLLERSQAAQRGDVRGRLHGFDVEALTFKPGVPGAGRADQEAVLKVMNEMVLCTYPYVDAQPATLPEDLCRQPGSSFEWQADAAHTIKQWYGGDGLPNAAFTEAPVPAGWAGHSTLFSAVVRPACIGCHQLLGTGNASAIDFGNLTKFDSYAERSRHLVYEHGDMPLSRLRFQQFWSTDPADGGMAAMLAAYFDAQGFAVARDTAGEPRPPGAPVAIAGPDRRVRLGDTTLSAANSLFADSFRWRIVSGPDGAVPPTGAILTGADSATPTFTADATAAQKRYVVELVASRAGVASAPARLTLYVNAAADRDPASYRLSDIDTLLNTVNGPPAGRGTCISCHGANASAPLAFTSGTEQYNVLRSLLNFDDLSASRLLRKPANENGHHVIGGRVTGYFATLEPGDAGFDAANPSVPPGDPQRAALDVLIDWAVSGAPRN